MSPLTLLEAQLMKKAIVATNVGGIPELMKDGETGFLVKKGNEQELIEKLSFLIINEKESKQMGEKGRAFVEENFSWGKIIKEIVNKIKDLIQNKKL